MVAGGAAGETVADIVRESILQRERKGPRCL
jgi:hypothetical protein